MSKTLYVTDLDGTLLGNDAKLSEYSMSILNDLIKKGMLFSYATARSILTAAKVTAGLQVKCPLIVYNGAFIMDGSTCEILNSNFFTGSELQDLQILLQKQEQKSARKVMFRMAFCSLLTYFPAALHF